MPFATNSSATYWTIGLRATVSISLGWDLVAGSNRVPYPATGTTALRITFLQYSGRAARRATGRTYLTFRRRVFYGKHSTWLLCGRFVDDMPDNQGGTARSFETAMDSTLDSGDAAENLVLQIAEESGFKEEDLHKIGMAVREAMVNAVVHGNRYNLKKKVHLTAG